MKDKTILKKNEQHLNQCSQSLLLIKINVNVKFFKLLFRNSYLYRL